MNGEPSKPAWYVLYGYPGQESKLRTRLQSRLATAGLAGSLVDILIPLRESGSLTKIGLVKTVYPVPFPGAVFVLAVMSRAVWDIIRQTPGLTGFYGTGSQPLAYPATGSPFQGETGAPAPDSNQPRGRLVRILNGPFRDFRGVVFDVDEQHARLRVMIEFHQRPTPLDLGYEDVEHG